MDENPEEREMFELLDALCDERLDARQGERLQRLLKDDVQAQQTYLDFLDTHLALRKLSRTRDAESTLPLDASYRHRTDPPGRGVERGRRVRLAVLGAAAAVLIAITISLALQRGRPQVDHRGGAGGVGVVDRGGVGVETPRLTQSRGGEVLRREVVADRRALALRRGVRAD